MKKLLGIMVLGLLWCNVSFSKEAQLTCEYVETYYRNWDNKQYGEILQDEEAVKSIFFKIIKGENNLYGFKTNMYLFNWEAVEGGNFSSNIDNDNYSFYKLKNKTYISIKINRYNGILTYTTGHTNDDSRYLIQYWYNCKKAEQKF